MNKQKKMQLALVTIANFIADEEIDPVNVEPLMKYLVGHDLEPTQENLKAAHDVLSKKYWEEHPEERPQESDAEFKASIEKMGFDEYKLKLKTDPEFRARVDNMQ